MSWESDLLKDGVSSNPNQEEQDLMMEEAQKMSSVQPTMWLGAQNGWLVPTRWFMSLNPRHTCILCFWTSSVF